jgi:ABC-type sugar transport system substrate-binding protein
MKTLWAVPFLSLLTLTACGPGGDSTPGTDPAQSADATSAAEDAAATTAKDVSEITIGVMPKLVSIPYFNACEQGARIAAEELGITLLYDGPTEPDVTRQVELLETWIARKVDAIAIAPNNPEAIAPVLLKARKRGIKILTWDADARVDARDFFINQATNQDVAHTLMDLVAQDVGEDAKYVIITGTLTASNQNIWMDEMEKYRQEKYPNMTNLLETPLAPGEDQARATQFAGDALKAHPDLQAIIGITSVALPGAAEAVRKAGAADRIYVTGLALPNTMKEYIADGTIKRFALWNAVDLGYLSVYAALASVQGGLKAGDTSAQAGALGEVRIDGDEIILGPPIVFSSKNIGEYDF